MHYLIALASVCTHNLVVGRLLWLLMHPLSHSQVFDRPGRWQLHLRPRHHQHNSSARRRQTHPCDRPLAGNCVHLLRRVCQCGGPDVLRWHKRDDGSTTSALPDAQSLPLPQLEPLALLKPLTFPWLRTRRTNYQPGVLDNNALGGERESRWARFSAASRFNILLPTLRCTCLFS